MSFFAEKQIDKHIRNKFFPNYSQSGIMVEVGAATPEFLSMSRHFKLNNWRVIAVEPNPIFVEQHKKINNEIYQYACSFENKDDVEFTIVHQNIDQITDHSFSSFYIKEELLKNYNFYSNELPKTVIKVKQRTLDYILKEANVSKIDLLSVDVEGWEIEVMRGLNTIKPTVVVLENVFENLEYSKYMNSIGYDLIEHYYINDIYCCKI